MGGLLPASPTLRTASGAIITVTGAPAAGQVIVADDAGHAHWGPVSGGGGGTSFDPATLAAKVLWLRAKDLGAPGTAVTTWPDWSGAVHNATSPHDNPTIAAATTPAGGKSLALNHSRLILPSLGLVGAGEMWVVLRSTNANPTDANACSWSLGTTAAPAQNNYYGYGGAISDDFGTNTQQSFTPGVDLTQWRLYRVSLTNGGAGTGTWQAWLDNVSQKTVAGAPIAWRGNPRLSGDAADSIGNGFVGNYAEVLIRSQVSTPAEVASLITYFNTQHGLTVPGGS